MTSEAPPNQKPSPARYVCGFLFMADGRPDFLTDYLVVLIRKNKPDWQRGLLNGVGGKIEPGESPEQAMVREFEEETGRPTSGWLPLVTMSFPKAVIHFFYLLSSQLVAVRSTTDEPVEVLRVGHLINWREDLIPNLHWLIPMALHDMKAGAPNLIYGNQS